MEDSNVIEIPEFFGNKIKTLYIINKDGITVKNANTDKVSLFIKAKSINAFRYGVKFARGYAFYIGRKYWIEIKYNEDEILKIALNSYYRLKRKVYESAWRNITQMVWTCYFVDFLKQHIVDFNEKQEFEIAGFAINTDGVTIAPGKNLKWSDVAVSYYRTYFMVYKRDDPKIHKSGTFANDWNAFMAQEFFRRLLASYKEQKD